MVAQEKSAKIFIILIKEIDKQQEKLKKLEDVNVNIKNLVFKEYYIFFNIFDYKKAYEFPLYCLCWDHEIILKEGIILSKTDSLKKQSSEEFNVLKEYIINNLGLKFIESS